MTRLSDSVHDFDNLADKRRWADEKFRIAVESAPHGAVIVDDLGRIILVNSQVEKLFGYQREELWGQPVELLVPDRFRTSHIDHRQNFFVNPSVRAMGAGRDLYGRRKDGSEFPVEIGLTPIDVGEERLVLSAIVDISARKRAEEKFRLVVESAPNGLVMINDRGRIVLVNAQTERLFGYGRAELLDQPIELLVPERFRAPHPDYRDSYFANPVARSMGVGRDLTGRRKDGSEFPVEIGLTPLRTEDGLFALSAIVDITERQRAEINLRKAHDQLELRVQERTMDLARLAVNLRAQAELLELAHDAIMVRTFDGTITFWNGGAEELYGWSKQEATGEQKHDLLKPEFPRPRSEVEEELLRTGHWEGTLRHVRKDGVRIVVASRWALKSDEQGQPTTVLEINSDVTEQKIANDRIAEVARDLERSNAELGAANKELEAFSYSISHDLRAPLRAIDGFSRILVQEYGEKLPEDAVDCLREVRTNTQRMGQLVDDLLAFSRLSRQPIKQEPVLTEHLVRQCLDELRPQQQGRQIDVRIGTLAASHGDRALLKQVWFNLLSNALKYSGKNEAAVIEIGNQTNSENGEKAFFVKDNGVGFDMRYANKLFGVFQRLHRSEDYEGTGVGLAIVQRIVHRHGGRVWAQSQVGKGTTFFFTLSESEPLHEPPSR